jgi:dTDP-4-amino-4,6-dideoxygalactose transaminase
VRPMPQLALYGGVPVRNAAFPRWPVFDRSEERALLEVLHSGNWWHASQGESSHHADAIEPLSKTAELELAFAKALGAERAIACANGSAALEVALKAAGVGPGDEVIVPPYTFVATATAALLLGATPIFCDIERDTFNIDPAQVERAITRRTKAVIPVHFAGMAADMDRLRAIAGEHELFLLEDAAHSHGARWRDRALGTIGHAGTFSFQASKNMTAGEGGMIVTNDPEFAELCESYIWAGRKYGRPWYEHHRLGWNYRITEFQSAILIEQLKRLEAQTARRMRNGLFLNTKLAAVPGIHPLRVPEWVTRHSFHIYVFRFDAEEFGLSREEFVRALQAEGVPCSTGYAAPLYKAPMFPERRFHVNDALFATIDYDEFAERCPQAERACREAVWIEHRVLLGEEDDMKDILRAVMKIYENRSEFSTSSTAAAND